MKILLLCWRDTEHPQGGGSERYLEHIAAYLAARGHEVVFRTASFTDAPARETRQGVLFSRAGGKYGVYPRAWLAMLAGRLGLGALRGVDVVVDTQNGIPFFARAVAGKPTVLLTHHCHREQWPVAGPLIARLGWFLESKMAPRAYRGSQYVTVSHPSKQELVDLGVRAQDIHLIRNGVDPVPAHLPTLEEDGLHHLVTLSRLVPHKQIEHAMDAVAALRRHGVVLDVLGSGWWNARLRDYVRERGMEDVVVFHGQVSEDYKHAQLARAAVHLMPSRKEGWGLAVMEAAQHGVPTVGYRSAGGLNDSIEHEHTGLLVDTPEELTAATRRLLIDAPLRRRLGTAAAQQATAFSWQEAGARFERLLLDVASEQP
ncbi:glycosyltransferase family 4 protein [Corynebacterium lowii]|uniref:GDP-mannose-dependent alpha-(1-6)-phosphatidylinositol monomannoside mannosyltransferase n=1 Tax=Corynebacterium lowii TaxID=1544413 RepID=A0A0Q0Z8Y2_9CORY|nr:glycosyltransferase family 4 protein [Corynebacterium lowii]KQB86067.1 GDP-mannose-dependent alpha-(1-6)-phosphatidylinositol monomannoside mannosyltransferase [Corynebacterium lowii]MDP9852539.1 glycosyltransferase involved in cell wall biosynthesis [Corynebacterium lowii]